jgi:hypothetical protein
MKVKIFFRLIKKCRVTYGRDIMYRKGLKDIEEHLDIIEVV